MAPTTSSTKIPLSENQRKSNDFQSSVKISDQNKTWSDLRMCANKVIDLRAPVEFEKGRIPSAINVPLFDDNERHEIGLTYKTKGSKVATGLGLELFAKKIDSFLNEIEQHLSDKKEITLQCWRGGQRSTSVAYLLASIGYKPTIVSGGYKGYRRFVLDVLDNEFAKHKLLVLHGRTGSGKTTFLHDMPKDFPTIDFEGLAHHRGSTFGGFAQAEPCPTQQNFENQLCDEYLKVASHNKILVEIENFIGPLVLPLALRDNVKDAPIVLVDRDFDDRVERLASEYARGWKKESDTLFVERIAYLKRHVSKEDIQKVIDAVLARDFRTATSLLLKLRYDPIYDKGMRKHESQIIARFNLTHDKEAAEQFVAEYIQSK